MPSSNERPKWVKLKQLWYWRKLSTSDRQRLREALEDTELMAVSGEAKKPKSALHERPALCGTLVFAVCLLLIGVAATIESWGPSDTERLAEQLVAEQTRLTAVSAAVDERWNNIQTEVAYQLANPPTVTGAAVVVACADGTTRTIGDRITVETAVEFGQYPDLLDYCPERRVALYGGEIPSSTTDQLADTSSLPASDLLHHLDALAGLSPSSDAARDEFAEIYEPMKLTAAEAAAVSAETITVGTGAIYFTSDLDDLIAALRDHNRPEANELQALRDAGSINTYKPSDTPA